MADGLLVGLFLVMALAVFWFIGSLADGRYSEEYGGVASAPLPVYWHEEDAPSMYAPNLVHPTGFWFPENGDSSTGAVSFCFFVPWGASEGVVVRTGGGEMYTVRARQRALDGAADYADRKFGHLAAAATEQRQREVVQARAEVQRHEVERVATETREAKERTEQQARWDRERVEREARWRAEQVAAEALKQKLSGAIPLKLPTGSDGIVFGTEIESGTDFVVPFDRLQHMLIAGVSGSGKSFFMHQLLVQLVTAPQVDKIYLVDLKGGVEFNRYRGGKVSVIWRYTDVVAVVDELVALMEARQDEMRERGLQTWPLNLGRTFLIIDEYAEIQSDLDEASTPEEKRVAKRLSGNLGRLSRRARALGLILVCAIQKPTLDGIGSGIRSNLACRICLRLATRALASSMLDELDDLPADPVKLRTGRFIYYDASRGVRRYVQAHVAPGIEL